MGLKALNAGIAAPSGSKQWIEEQITRVIGFALHGAPPKVGPVEVEQKDGTTKTELRPIDKGIPRDHALALTGLMHLAKLKGYIVEKKQSFAGKLDLNRLPADQLRATLEQTMDQLSPGERLRIEKMLAAPTDEDENILEAEE